MGLAGVMLLALAIAVPLAAQQGNLDELNARVIELYRARKFLEAVPVAEEAIRVAEATFGKDHPKLATAINNLAILYDSQGEYVKAEPLYKQALEIRQKALGETDPAVATTLNDLATMYTDQGRFAEAEGMLQRALAIREKAYGPEHSAVATSLNDLAVLYKAEGKYADAEPLLRRALAIWEKTLGPDHPDLATSLNNLAVLYDTQGKYVDAEPLYKRALAIREKALGPEHPSVANTLNDLATMYVDQARYADAEPMLRRALAIREKALGAYSGPVAISLNDLGMLYRAQGKYAESEPLLERALAIRRKILSSDSPELATSLNNLAVVYNSQGKFDEAEPLFLRALEIREKTLGPNDPKFATQLSNLAEMYVDRGKYAEAEPLFLRVLNIRERVLGLEHADAVSSRKNLAAVYKAEGRYAEAEPLLRQVVAILEKSLGRPDHPYLANSLNDLAQMYKEQGKYSQAESGYQRALSIQEKALGSDNPALVIPLNTLGELYKLQGNYPEAEKQFQRALAIGTKHLGQDHPSVATSLNSLAEVYLAQGKLAEAEPLLQRALAIRTKALGPDHAETGTILENLGLAYYGLKRPREAEEYFDRRLQNLAKQFDEHFGRMSEKERLAFLNKVAMAFPTYFSFCFSYRDQNPGLAGKMYDVLLWEKGLVTRTIGAMRERIAASGDKKAMDLLEKLTVKRAELAALSGAEPAEREQWRKTLERLNEEANYLERELAERSGALGEPKAPARFTWGEVQKLLRPGETAIEIAHFQFHDGKKWTDTYEYAALVVRPGSATAPTLVALGDAGKLEVAPIEEYHMRTSTKGGSAPARPGLYEAFWKPLEPTLAGARRIYLSPDGILDQVSFAVAADESGRLLMEKYDLRLVSSTRELLREKRKPAENSAVLIGNPSFDLGAAEQKAPQSFEQEANSGRAITTATTVRHSRERRIEPLGGTQAEVDALASMLQKHHWTVQVYAREKALKETLKRVKNPRVLHVATQSFNLPLPKEKPNAGASDRPSVLEDPMLRSGLYFAGANRTLAGGIVGPGVDDGILTAYEAAELDLHGTELVVLSASESGLGQAMSGEGVFGLRRALLEAGAEAVLVSMWNVPDKETQELMTLFYQRWLAGKDKHEALREAQLEMRARVKARYGGDRPALWGAFVLLGR